MQQTSIRVAALQARTEPRQYERNRARVEALLDAVAPERPDVIVMSEMFLQGHWYDADRLEPQYMEPLDGPTLAWMKAQSQRLGALLVGGISERLEGETRCGSTLLLVDGDTLLATYRKRHPASAELLFMKPGTQPAIVETRLGRVGLLTCFDMSFPECLQPAFERRVDVLLVSNAWLEMERMPFLMGQHFEHHRVLPRALAMQLRAPVVAANLVGPLRMLVPGLPGFGGGAFEFDSEFAGNSLICDAMGVVLEELPKEHGEGFIVADVDLAVARGTRSVTLDDAGLDDLRRHVFRKSSK
jgi:predicted amidohydrolase